jgi:hypothetical protein
MISLEEWHRRFPPGTHTQRLVWRRVTPVPTMPALEGFPPDMQFDWPPRLILGTVGYDWDEDADVKTHIHEINPSAPFITIRDIAP